MGAGVKEKETKAGAGFKPLKDRCFVSYTEELERTAGGIYIPDAAKEKPQRGKIERIGADVKAGDHILFGKYSGQEIKLDGEEYLIMREDEVLAVLDAATGNKKK